MKQYACGFLFSEDRKHVLLIRKNRPAWQAGKLNGIGGKLEPGETPADAMRREFREEAGLDVGGWQHALTLTGKPTTFDPNGWQGHFFRVFGDVRAAATRTDESLEVHEVGRLPPDLIPNLRWMIPLMLDDELLGGQYDLSLESRDECEDGGDFTG